MSSLEDMITVEEFIRLKDKDKFVWAHERDEDGGSTGAKQEQALALPKHVKLKPTAGGTFLPFEAEEKRLGHGRNTKVYKGVFGESGYKRPLAIKVVDCTLEPPVSMEKALREVRIMQRLEHPHVVVYVASYEMTILDQDDEIVEQRLGIAMYPPGTCNLRKALDGISEALRNAPSTNLDTVILNRIRHMFGYFGCLAQALSYIHTKEVRVKHKDIKPENIVIDHFEQPIITDFNISKRYTKEGEEMTTGGKYNTAKYAPPEGFEPQIHCGFYSDVFSLGCVFIEIATILLGGSRRNLKDYFHDKPYYLVMDDVHGWIEHKMPQIKPPPGSALETLLNTSSGDSGKTPRQILLDILPMISRMVKREIKQRPPAKELFEAFEPLYQFTPAACVCRHCKAQCDSLASIANPSTRLAERCDTTLEDTIEEDDVDTHAMETLDKHQPNGKASSSRDQTPPVTAPIALTRRPYQSRPRVVPSPMKRRSTTASVARWEKKDRKILIYEHSSPSGPRVTIGDTSIFNSESCGTIA